jgi:Transposase DDE domain
VLARIDAPFLRHKANKRVQFGYGLNYMIDVEHAVIIDVEATPARTYDEVAATRTMIDRTEKVFGAKPERLAADTAYGTGKMLAWLLDKGITPHIPVWERYQRTDGMFPCTDFAYDAERDIYLCPNGKPLRTSGTIHDGRVRNYLSRARECRVCSLKERCTRAPFRKIVRDVNEDARDHARSLKGTPEFEQSRNERKKVEMRFAHLKVNHRFERIRLRGLTGARDEFHLAAGHRAKSQDTRKLRLAAAAGQASCCACRVSVMPQSRPRSLKGLLPIPLGRSGERPRETDLQKAPIRELHLSSPTFSTASVKLRKARNEHMLSARAPITDMCRATSR